MPSGTRASRAPVISTLAGMKRALFPAIGLLLALTVAGALATFTRVSFWPVFGIVVAALLINGWVATFEDDAPGGLNNPDGTDTLPYVNRTRWFLRTVGVLLAVLCVAMVALQYFSER